MTPQNDKPEVQEPTEVVYQQLHKDCGGELAVCASKSTIRVICKRCRTAWDIYNPYSGFQIAIPAEWESYPGKGGAA